MTGDGSGELFEIAATLQVTGMRAPAIATAIVTKGALNIKNAMRADAAGIGHAPAFPETIGYDVTQTLRGPEAAIGPEDRGVGELAGILYFGTSKSGPTRNISVGLDAEAPGFEKALAEALEPEL